MSMFERNRGRFRAAVFDLGNTLMEFETRPFSELNRLGAENAARTLEQWAAGSSGASGFVERFLVLFRESVERSKVEEHREIPLSEIFPQLLTELGIPVEAALVAALVEAHYAPIVDQVSLYPGTADALAACRAKGLKLAIVSNTIWPEEFHRRDLDRFGILEYFDTLVFSSTLGVAKPHQRIFQTVLQELDLSAEEAFYVGDRPDVDVRGAQGAGMKAVLKTHPIRSRERYPGVTPDAVIDDLRELPEAIRV